MKTVRYLLEAQREFLHEVEYYAALSPGLAERFDAAVRATEDRAAQFPEHGAPYLYGTRRLFPGKFKFSIVYLNRPHEVLIVAIAPFDRRPGYWAARVQPRD